MISSASRAGHSPPPADPLHALGPALFLHTLTFLPFPSLLFASQVSQSWHRLLASSPRTLWRAQAHRLGVEPAQLRTLEALERSIVMPPPSTVWLDDDVEGHVETQGQGQGQGQGPVDWKEVCREYVGLQRNWQHGRCRERWVRVGGNTVWRIQVDREQGTLLATSRTGGLVVVDLRTSEPLFQLSRVRPWAHLEFANGFVVFDIGTDLSLQVFRTSNAIARSRSCRPPPPPTNLPATALSATSYTHPQYRYHQSYGADHVPLPRGHLSYYRKITPPSHCRAFRARVDHAGEVDGEGKSRERAVLGTAGTEGVYLWDLEEEGRVEEIRLAQGVIDEVNYIEFDETFVFICSPSTMHVLSRQTRSYLFAFPSDPSDPTLSASLAFTLDKLAMVPVPVRSTRPWRRRGARRREGMHWETEEDEYREVSVLEGVCAGVFREEAAFQGVVLGGVANLEREEMEEGDERVLEFDFSACHFTPDDLVCTSHLGAVLIVRDYKEAFALKDSGERDRRIRGNTVWVGLGEKVKLLSVHGTHVMISTASRFLVFDTQSLPSPPYAHPSSSTVRPTLKIHHLASGRPSSVRMSSCLQSDRSSLYAVYWTLGELEGREGEDVMEVGRDMPPQGAMQGFGVCVRVYDFAEPEAGEEEEEEEDARG